MILIFFIIFLVGSQLLLMIDIPRGPLFVVGIVGCAVGAVLRSNQIRFVRVRGEYLWYWGAGRGFLAKLPNWTFGE